MSEINKLIIIGNGFDLAHGLKTSYKNFLDWYFCKAFKEFCTTGTYNDPLIEIKRDYSGMSTKFTNMPTTLEETLNLISSSRYQSFHYNSHFFNQLIISFQKNSWVDIEKYYFRLLKSHFTNRNIDREKAVAKLNRDFDVLITQLTNYIKEVNLSIHNFSTLKLSSNRCNLDNVLYERGFLKQIKFLTFNYTETLRALDYADEKDIIHIHGRAYELDKNPIIFGYGDESDPTYQSIEDSGDNIYLEHIKSFGYFKTGNYHQLLSYIDSAPYTAYIIGHSCGISDRILLNEIFEHQNCQHIDIFYHRRSDRSDNFKDITQEISRHFKPHNKNIMRRKVLNKNPNNFIPQTH